MAPADEKHPIDKALERIGKDRSWLLAQVKQRGGQMGAKMLWHILSGRRQLTDRNKGILADILGSPSMLLELTTWQVERAGRAA